MEEPLTKDEARAIAKEAAQEAVTALLQRMGFDTTEWLEVQQDMAFVRKQRKGSEQIAVWTKRSVIGAFLSGALWILVEGIKSAIRHT